MLITPPPYLVRSLRGNLAGVRREGRRRRKEERMSLERLGQSTKPSPTRSEAIALLSSSIRQCRLSTDRPCRAVSGALFLKNHSTTHRTRIPSASVPSGDECHHHHLPQPLTPSSLFFFGYFSEASRKSFKPVFTEDALDWKIHRAAQTPGPGMLPSQG